MDQRYNDGCDAGPVQQESMSHGLLSAPHMLYNVFLHLPQQDLLLIQRVCRVWRGVITSSRVLQAALFLQPPVNAAVNESVRMNPLLVSRFPAFFDNKPDHMNLNPTAHCMGPYFTTHWAESIHPWARFSPKNDHLDGDCSFSRIFYPSPSEASALDELFLHRSSFHDSPSDNSPFNDLPSDDAEDPIVSVSDPLVGVPEHLDTDRTAAYRQPEASWRRMLPCIPPPVELQARYQTNSWPRAGTVRRLRFDIEDDSRRDECERRWVTFGLVYDVFEAAWFRSKPSAVSRWQFDWTFHDHRPQMQVLSFDDTYSHAATVEEMHNSEMYGDREELRDCLPDTPIGGTGRVLIMFSKYSKKEQKSADGRKRFRADLELQRLDENAIDWDEVIPYEIENDTS
jgi:hypothetical protein